MPDGDDPYVADAVAGREAAGGSSQNSQTIEVEGH